MKPRRKYRRIGERYINCVSCALADPAVKDTTRPHQLIEPAARNVEHGLRDADLHIIVGKVPETELSPDG